VVTVSDRSAAGERADTSGPLLVDLLRSLGFQAADPVVVPDETDAIEAALRAAIASGADLVVTTGGTGLGPRDVTPEATERVLDRPVPGIAEALRQFNREQIPTTVLSRAVAGVAGSSLVVNLPGSTGGVRDGVAVLSPVIGHAIAQLRGGDH
jgi:molybdenum cofactor biosynthesis protein B